MWSNRARASPSDSTDPAALTLHEMMAMRPRRVRGRLRPGERFPTGLRPGRRRAQGLDLDSIGPYVPGDDIRWMDWRATARTGRAQMKRFVAESHLARMLIVDFRPHLMFGTEVRPMAKTAGLLAARMAWEAFVLQEPVGAVLVPDQVLVRPRRGRSHVLFLLKHLEDSYRAALARAGSDGGDALAAAVDTASGLLRSGDEICVFSDFGDLPPALIAKVRELTPFRQFRAVIVEDPMLRRPLPAGRYPYRAAGDPVRRMATVSTSTATRHPPVVRELQRSFRHALLRDGWRITEVVGSRFLPPGDGQ